MNRKSSINHALILAASSLLSIPYANAADLYWGGGSTNIAETGDGESTYVSGTWNTAISNWDQGAGQSHVAWNNSGQNGTNLDNAIFAGTYVESQPNRIITIGSNITVNQIEILAGGWGSASRYDIGDSATQNNVAITFGGTYSPAFPTITGISGASGFLNNNFNAKVTGDLTSKGGLVLSHGSNIASPTTTGRFAFTNTNNDFIGDIVVVAGNLSMSTGTTFGNAANRIVLHGGALFASTGSTVTTTFARNISVNSASGITNSANPAGTTTIQAVFDLTGMISGSGNLTRYSQIRNRSTTSTLRLSGDMSGYTGIFESAAPVLDNGGISTNSIVVIQTTATSGGSWKISGGTLRLNTTNDSHIANGSGKSDLIINDGRLDMNGKSETINGLSGNTGTVRNDMTATLSTLTLGDGDATASYGGIIVNGSATVAVTKIGAGTQTISGANLYTGATTVNAGTLKIGANHVIQNSSNVSIGSATLNADTYTDILGSLDVTGAAVINLGSGASLAFADSKTVDWTGGTLNITGTLGATSLRFGDSADDLTVNQLGLIRVNGSGLGTYVLNANGYLVASYNTWASAKGLTGLPGSSTDPAKNADPDMDGRSNIGEFAFNGDPLNGADYGKVFVFTDDSSLDVDTDKELILTVAVRSGTPAFTGSPSPSANHAANGITYNIEGSLDLAIFLTTVEAISTPVVHGSLPPAGEGYEYRSFRLAASNGLTGKGFLRAKVTTP